MSTGGGNRGNGGDYGVTCFGDAGVWISKDGATAGDRTGYLLLDKVTCARAEEYVGGCAFGQRAEAVLGSAIDGGGRKFGGLGVDASVRDVPDESDRGRARARAGGSDSGEVGTGGCGFNCSADDAGGGAYGKPRGRLTAVSELKPLAGMLVACKGRFTVAPMAALCVPGLTMDAMG